MLEGKELSDALLTLYEYAPLNREELGKVEGYLNQIENKNIKLITMSYTKRLQ